MLFILCNFCNGFLCFFWFQGKHSLGLMWFLLTREVLRLKGTISRELPWDVVPDLFFYRDPEEARTSIIPTFHFVLPFSSAPTGGERGTSQTGTRTGVSYSRVGRWDYGSRDR